MKLFDITHFYACESGGVKTYLDKKHQYLLENSDTEHVMLLPSDKDKVENGKKYFIKSPLIPFWKPYRLLIEKRKILHIIEAEQPDIVEVGSPYLLPKWICKHSKKHGYKTVGFFHANVEESIKSILKSNSKQISHLIRRYIRREYKDFDIVIAPSQYMKSYLKGIGIENTYTVYLGTDTENFSPDRKDPDFRKKYNIPENKTLLIYTGRLSSDKNIFELVQIFKKLDSMFPEKYHLIIAGSGPDEEKLKEELQENTTFLGYIKDRNKLSTIYSSCDIFITPSKAETFGLAIIEAQAAGLPVVAFNTASLPEVAVNPNLLAEDVTEFIRNIIHAEKLLKTPYRYFISNTIKEKFSWNKTFQNLLEVYNNVLRNSKKPAFI
ncbi:glycosyltransferase [Desulfurobacterium atlanticum]|uniref:Glycosyltransferase involved in cell wall bisynthesis n=1 Tax=Desulfurobacterium atlanticum TaxID=240169 RepID=A0A238ZFI8_9BACT|nr:glycosyltransferase [Desulfurobacterium atlanticum]SNR82256.1 Glycosyltransferase involved in cell wall bisynthesis [Desulfurobacterium atlanticum]